MEKQMVNFSINQNSRNFGIDLLRIVSMFMICVLHVLSYGGVTSSAPFLTSNYIAAKLMDATACVAVNCYALISGYVGVKSKFKITNIINLWLQVVFYTGLIALGFAIFRGGVKTFELIFAFLPVFNQQYWYFTAYFGLFFFMPLLNCALNNVDKNILKYCLMTITVFFIFYSLGFIDNFSLSGGFSTLWLMLLYLLGGYIGIYKPFNKISNAWLIIIIVVSVILVWSPQYLIEYFNAKNGSLEKLYEFKDVFTNYIAPQRVIMSIAMLELFSRFKLYKARKLIGVFASTSFGVYLIHFNVYLRELFLHNKFVNFATYNPIIMILAVLGASIAVYLICSLIDYLRLLLFKLLKIKSMLTKLETKINNKFFKEEICLKTTEN